MPADAQHVAEPTHGHPGRARLHRRLFATYLVWWAVLAIAPVNRQDWFLENILAAALVGLVAGTYRRFQLSDRSYLLITVFMMMHAVGAHYTYEHVPAGDWLRDALGLERNHFDRLAHFLFGLLMTYPIREVFVRLARLTGFWGHYFTLTTVIASSGFFEILEAWVAQVVSPELGALYLGTQGDIWDAQHDMLAAFSGAVLCTVLTVTFERPAGR